MIKTYTPKQTFEDLKAKADKRQKMQDFKIGFFILTISLILLCIGGTIFLEKTFPFSG